MPFTFGVLPRIPQITATVQCEGGEVEIYNYIVPTYYHSIKVTTKDGASGSKTRFEKIYTFPDAKVEGKGESWWTTYRYQLEAFVDKLKGRTPQTWVNREDSITNMECIEHIYAHVSFTVALALEVTNYLPPDQSWKSSQVGFRSTAIVSVFAIFRKIFINIPIRLP